LRQRIKRRKPSVIQNILNQRNDLKPIVQAKLEKIKNKTETEPKQTHSQFEFPSIKI
jgi:hypothetical protein